MKWSIAILTVPERFRCFTELRLGLQEQIGDRDVELLVAAQNWDVSSKRQWCLDHAKGEYFNFIDDDDRIADNYVDTIYPLLDGVDYIGFRMQLYIDGVRYPLPTFHSLKYDRWFENETGFYRNVSHLNPIRTEIARQGHFEGGFGEDRRWAAMVKPKTEHYIEDCMYHYMFSTDK